jgi:miniconductance mechanosensitive channel
MNPLLRHLADPGSATPTARALAATAVLLLAVCLHVLGTLPIRRWLRRLIARSQNAWDDLLLSDRMLRLLAGLLPLWVLHAGALFVLAGLDRAHRFADRLFLALIVALLLRIVANALDALERISRRLGLGRSRPVKAFVQLATFFVYAFGFVIIASLLLDRPAWGFLSGLGALSAVLLLVFKDSLLGLAASFQISANRLVQLGDWIEMPKYDADGDVIDISLQTIQVQNWDKTITSIPIYAFVSDSFRNWRGMTEAGARRIARPVLIDLRSVRFCDDEMLDRFRRIHLLKDYIGVKTLELREYNERHGIDPSVSVNGRRLTNVGTFRAYVETYLRQHPSIRQDMTRMVRQLEPGPQGLPLQVYAFAATTVWIEYEAIQADIFDHLFAILPEFGLHAFQSPSGWDLDRLAPAVSAGAVQP